MLLRVKTFKLLSTLKLRDLLLQLGPVSKIDSFEVGSFFLKMGTIRFRQLRANSTSQFLHQKSHFIGKAVRVLW